ncbi:MAG: hypothetical protein HKN29_00605 [Rhodothermales bacterium]|nr:hypothetical protein [Rhodothermales bacterium]
MDRRTALNRIALVLGAAVSGPSAAAFLSGCRVPDGLYEPVVFTDGELASLGQIVETILPRTDTGGALDAGVHHYIDLLLAEYYPQDESAALAQGIRDLIAHVQGEPAELFDQLREIDERIFREGAPRRADEPYSVDEAYREVRQMTLVGYYTSQVGEEQELRPHDMGPYQGDFEMAQDGRARV